MNALTEVQVLDAEERLRLAMMASDVPRWRSCWPMTCCLRITWATC